MRMYNSQSAIYVPSPILHSVSILHMELGIYSFFYLGHHPVMSEEIWPSLSTAFGCPSPGPQRKLISGILLFVDSDHSLISPPHECSPYLSIQVPLSLRLQLPVTLFSSVYHRCNCLDLDPHRQRRKWNSARMDQMVVLRISL